MTASKLADNIKLVAKRIVSLISLWLLAYLPSCAAGLRLELGGGTTGTETSVQLLILLTILSVAPSILLMTTSFVRIVIVFSILRQAMGIGQLPPTQVLISLAMILTFLIMQPTFTHINNEAIQPFVKNQITQDVFLDRAIKPLRKFMLAQTKETELKTALKLGKITAKLKSPDEVPLHLLTLAFMLGELKAAFQIGFMLFLPFVIIDLLVSSALVSVGLMFLPPTTLSLPFKIILFVLVDGWNILCEGLVNSFQVVN